MKKWEEKAEIISEEVDALRNSEFDLKGVKLTKKATKKAEIAMLWFFLTYWKEDITPRLKEKLETMLIMHIGFYERQYGEVE